MAAVAIDGIDEGAMMVERLGNEDPRGVIGGAAGRREHDRPQAKQALTNRLHHRDVLNVKQRRLIVPAAQHPPSHDDAPIGEHVRT